MGRTPAVLVGGNASGMSWEYKRVRAEKEEPSQGGWPQQAAEGQQVRLVDGSSSRYAGRLVPGLPQAAAAAARLKDRPYRRAKQLLCKQTSQHRHIQGALHVSHELLSGPQQDFGFTERW